MNGKESWLPGEARNSWLTGTAAWMFVAASQAILGVKPQFDGLMIDPCLPQSVKELKVSRIFRGNTYEIEMENLAGGEKGVISLEVNGMKVDGKVIPLPEGEGKMVKVKVKIQ